MTRKELQKMTDVNFCKVAAGYGFESSDFNNRKEGVAKVMLAIKMGVEPKKEDEKLIDKKKSDLLRIVIKEGFQKGKDFTTKSTKQELINLIESKKPEEKPEEKPDRLAKAIQKEKEGKPKKEPKPRKKRNYIKITEQIISALKSKENKTFEEVQEKVENLVFNDRGKLTAQNKELVLKALEMSWELLTYLSEEGDFNNEFDEENEDFLFSLNKK